MRVKKRSKVKKENICHYFLKRFIYWNAELKEREGEIGGNDRERSFVHWFTLQRAISTRTVPGHAQKLGASSRSPTWLERLKYLDYVCCFQIELAWI